MRGKASQWSQVLEPEGTAMSSSSPIPPARRARWPRVRISYEATVGDALERVEFPCVIGVLADLSGSRADLPPLQARRFLDIDRDNFDAVLAACAPRLALSVPDLLAADPRDALQVALRFRSLADFGPDAIATQVAPLRVLLESRGSAQDPAEVDRWLSAQLNVILHHPDFQRLEAAWRGLHYLVTSPQPRADLRFRVLSCTRQELVEDQRRSASFEQSALFQKVHEEPYRTPCGVPFGLLVGDFEFSPRPNDVELLRHIAAVAASAHAPFVAAASPRMVGLDRWAGLAETRDLAAVVDQPEYAEWRAFRESEESRFVALTLPRVLARLPYGRQSAPAGPFPFEEEVRLLDQYLWMSAAWTWAARVADSFAQHGWFAASRGIENGGKVENLPVHTFPTDAGAVAMKCPTEIAISDRREYELSSLGFLPLLHARNRDFVVFMGNRSCNHPRFYNDPRATAMAEVSAEINTLLCVSRFAHYLKMMTRDHIGPFLKTVEYEKWFNSWIRDYVHFFPDPDDESVGPEARAKSPLREARIDVRQMPGRPGHYQAVAYLHPYYQLEPPVVGIRLEISLPLDRSFRPAPIDRDWLAWNGGTVVQMARAIREGGRFADLPILADMLEDAGCSDPAILEHCRNCRSAVRNCWVLDAILTPL
jgi:type VI secretion system protein ImpC